MSGKKVIASMYVGSAPSKAPPPPAPKTAGSIYAPAKQGSPATSVYVGGGTSPSSAPKVAAAQSTYMPGAKSVASSVMPGAATPPSGPISNVVADQQQPQETLESQAPPVEQQPPAEQPPAEGGGGGAAEGSPES